MGHAMGEIAASQVTVGQNLGGIAEALRPDFSLEKEKLASQERIEQMRLNAQLEQERLRNQAAEKQGEIMAKLLDILAKQSKN